jgi:hypothetical protein
MPPNPNRDDSAKKRPPPTPAKVDQKADRKGEEALREQSKTEVEERPYLDTEGGE